MPFPLQTIGKQPPSPLLRGSLITHPRRRSGVTVNSLVVEEFDGDYRVSSDDLGFEEAGGW